MKSSLHIHFYPRFSWRAAFRVWQRNFTVYLKFFLSSAMAYAVEPLVYLLGMGFGVGLYIHHIEGISYLDFIAPGMVASSAMFATSFECTFGSFVRMRYQRTFEAIVATPIQAEEVIVGELLWGMSKAVFYGTVILIVIACFGVVHSPAALLIPFLLVLPGFVFAITAMTFTAFTPSIDCFNYYISLFVTPLFFFSGIFFPLGNMPLWVQTVAHWTPLYHMVVLCRAMVVGQLSWGLWSHVLWLALFVLVFFPIPIYCMRRRLIH